MFDLGNLLCYGGIGTVLWIAVAGFIAADGRADINKIAPAERNWAAAERARVRGARRVRRGARLLLATPIFPAVLVALIGIASIKGIRALIALAEPREFWRREEL